MAAAAKCGFRSKYVAVGNMFKISFSHFGCNFGFFSDSRFFGAALIVVVFFWELIFFFWTLVVELVGGGSVINRAYPI